MRAVVLSIIAVSAFCASCSADPHAYTLYRNSSVDASARYHVATFDAAESSEYNRDNCEIAQRLFATQPGVSVKYWCEAGRYRP